MAFNMKGSPAKLGTIQGTAGHTSALKMMEEKAKDSPAKLNPSYVTTFDADGNATKKMVSDRHADAVEKSGKARGKDGEATDAIVERTGLSEYKHQTKRYDKKGGSKVKASTEAHIKPSYVDYDVQKANPQSLTATEKKAEEALEASKSDPKVIAEEKKQAQEFPEDVKESVRLRNTKKNRHVNDPKDEISARGTEAHNKIETDKKNARNKKQIKAKENKAVQASDKTKSETKKES